MNKSDKEEVFHKTSINWYPGHMAKTKRLISENLNLIDIVYEVVDARMPYSSKIKYIDNFTKNKPKILIMTKADLCDINITNKWLEYYEKQNYKVVLIDLEHNPDIKNIIKTTEAIMTTQNEKRLAKGIKIKRTRALVVGIPNVGKSTLINRLVGKKATKVGNKPGITKNLEWIRISDELELLDSPGILWPKLDEEQVAFNLASLTAIKEEVLPLYAVAEYIINTLSKYYPHQLVSRYGIESLNDDFTETLEIIGRRRGCLLKGNEIDYDKVISIIINEVKNGTIKGITFDRIASGQNDK